MPLVSVIVPIFNSEAFLKDALESLCHQSLENLEFILVDDGSLDHSLEICKSFVTRDSRFKLFQQVNSGVSAARNLGLSKAQGDYIGFLDSDDTAKPEMFSNLYEAIRSSGADMAMGGYEKVSDGKVISSVTLPYVGTITGNDVRSVAWSMAFWGGRCNGKILPTLYGSTWPNLYRRSIIIDHDIRFPDGVTIGEDLIFNLRYLKITSSVTFVNQPLYRYSLGNSSATRRMNPRLLDKYLEILDHVSQILSEPGNRELQHNLNRQALSYAINVIEEQGRLMHSQAEKRRLIREVCNNPSVHKAACDLLSLSSPFKDLVQALLFARPCVSLLNYWLAK